MNRKILAALGLGLLALGCASDESQSGAQTSADTTAARAGAEASIPPCPCGTAADFDVRHELAIKVPDGAKSLKIWFATPREDEIAQRVRDLKIESPVPVNYVYDNQKNRLAYAEIENPTLKEFKIVETFKLTRWEWKSGDIAMHTRPYQTEDFATMGEYLHADKNIAITDEMKKIARDVVGNETNPVLMARRLYDWVLDNVDYWVKDQKTKKASPVGSSEYCLSTRTGNCTDFHSLWIALARAANIPARLKYGSFLKLELDGQDADQSYHCWPEFWAPNIGWVPHDVAVADIFRGEFVSANEEEAKKVRLTTAAGYHGPDPVMVNYYFGNLDNRRVTWTMGRDLELSPKQEAGPVNALPKAYVEVDGKVGAEKEVWTRKLTYKEIR